MVRAHKEVLTYEEAFRQTTNMAGIVLDAYESLLADNKALLKALELSKSLLKDAVESGLLHKDHLDVVQVINEALKNHAVNQKEISHANR